MKNYKEILKIFFVITDILSVLSILILPRLSLFSIRTFSAIIGYESIRIGGGGLLDNKILMTRGPDIKYGKDSPAGTLGKVFNVMIIIIGALIILCSIFV